MIPFFQEPTILSLAMCNCLQAEHQELFTLVLWLVLHGICKTSNILWEIVSVFMCDFCVEKFLWISSDSKGITVQKKVKKLCPQILHILLHDLFQFPRVPKILQCCCNELLATVPNCESFSTDCPILDTYQWLMSHDISASTL